MDQHIQIDGSTKAGTIGGTLLILFINVSSAEIGKTMVMAGVGAIVSFSVSMVLRRIVRYIQKK
ncbi:MAG: hypothetical protein ABIW38_06710 [Ferruginibacter sp.]